MWDVSYAFLWKYPILLTFQRHLLSWNFRLLKNPPCTICAKINITQNLNAMSCLITYAITNHKVKSNNMFFQMTAVQFGNRASVDMPWESGDSDRWQTMHARSREWMGHRFLCATGCTVRLHCSHSCYTNGNMSLSRGTRLI